MSSTNTALIPTFAPSGGGGGGKRGRDDPDDRPPDKLLPLDRISAADFGINGAVRKIVLLLMQLVNLGDMPSLLTNSKKNVKPEWECPDIVRNWLTRGIMRAPPHSTSHLAMAFSEVCWAANRAGYLDQLVALMTELLLAKARARLAEDSDDEFA